MNKKVRILLAFAFFVAILVAGVGAPAWAAKLNSGSAAPADNGLSPSVLAGPRREGTVRTTPTCVQTILAGKFTVGSIASWALTNVAGGKVYTACVVKPIDLPARLPGVPLTYPIKLTVSSSATLGVDERVCFPLPPGQNSSATFWDGKGWVKTEDPKDGQACVTLPASTSNPAYAGLAAGQ